MVANDSRGTAATTGDILPWMAVAAPAVNASALSTSPLHPRAATFRPTTTAASAPPGPRSWPSAPMMSPHATASAAHPAMPTTTLSRKLTALRIRSTAPVACRAKSTAAISCVLGATYTDDVHRGMTIIPPSTRPRVISIQGAVTPSQAPRAAAASPSAPDIACRAEIIGIPASRAASAFGSLTRCECIARSAGVSHRHGILDGPDVAHRRILSAASEDRRGAVAFLRRTFLYRGSRFHLLCSAERTQRHALGGAHARRFPLQRESLRAVDPARRGNPGTAATIEGTAGLRGVAPVAPESSARTGTGAVVRYVSERARTVARRKEVGLRVVPIPTLVHCHADQRSIH